VLGVKKESEEKRKPHFLLSSFHYFFLFFLFFSLELGPRWHTRKPEPVNLPRICSPQAPDFTSVHAALFFLFLSSSWFFSFFSLLPTGSTTDLTLMRGALELCQELHLEKAARTIGCAIANKRKKKEVGWWESRLSGFFPPHRPFHLSLPIEISAHAHPSPHHP